MLQHIPVDNAPVVESFHSLSHAEEAVLDIVTTLFPASAICQPILEPMHWLHHTVRASKRIVPSCAKT